MGGEMIEKYGWVKVRQIVSDFYAHVLGSPRLTRYFDGVDIQGLVGHQSAFLAAVMGGPESHRPDEIRDSHAPLAVSREDFDETIRLLRSSLERFGVDEGDREMIEARYRSYEDLIVANGEGSG